MNSDKMTIKLRQAIGDADMLAHDRGNAEITSEHLLLALLSQKEGLLPPLSTFGVPPKLVWAKLHQNCGQATQSIWSVLSALLSCAAGQPQLYAAEKIA